MRASLPPKDASLFVNKIKKRDKTPVRNVYIMMKQDDKIKQLFDNFADELTPRDDLSNKAKATLRQKRPRSGRGWIFAVAMACVALLIVSSVLRIVTNGNGDHGSDVKPPQQEEQYSTFALSDVKGTRLAEGSKDFADAAKLVGVELFKDASFTVVSQRYVAFYFKNNADTLAYVKAYLLVRSDDCALELTIIAETDGFVSNDLQWLYRSGTHGSVSQSNVTEQGEYASIGFVRNSAENTHFYVYATGGSVGTHSRHLVDYYLLQKDFQHV